MPKAGDGIVKSTFDTMKLEVPLERRFYLGFQALVQSGIVSHSKLAHTSAFVLCSLYLVLVNDLEA